MEVPKTVKEFKCLMKQRKDTLIGEYSKVYKGKLRKNSFGINIHVDKKGNPLSKEDRRILCEINKISLSTENTWVECGPVVKVNQYNLVRNITIYQVYKEWEEHFNLGFVLKLNVLKDKKSAKYWLKEAKSGFVFGTSPNPKTGSFCAVKGGC